MDRNPDDYNRPGYRPYFRPQSPRWPEVFQYPPAGYLPPISKNCCCGDRLNSIDNRLYVIEKKLTNMQSTVENFAAHHHSPSGPQEELQSPSTASGISIAASGCMEQEVIPFRIPPTSRERRDLIKKMEHELEERRKENRQHEERIAGLRRELEELQARNKSE